MENIISGDLHETSFEHIEKDNFMRFFSSERTYISKLRKLAQEYPEDVMIDYENSDGSICGRINAKFIAIRPPIKRNLSDEQREELRERMKQLRK